jgi:hypothetical protein
VVFDHVQGQELGQLARRGPSLGGLQLERPRAREQAPVLEPVRRERFVAQRCQQRLLVREMLRELQEERAQRPLQRARIRGCKDLVAQLEELAVLPVDPRLPALVGAAPVQQRRSRGQSGIAEGRAAGVGHCRNASAARWPRVRTHRVAGALRRSADRPARSRREPGASRIGRDRRRPGAPRDRRSEDPSGYAGVRLTSSGARGPTGDAPASTAAARWILRPIELALRRTHAAANSR